MTQAPNLEELLDGRKLWRGGRPASTGDTLASGHPALDRRLPGGGWPRGVVMELFLDRPGQGEWSVLLPLLAQVTASRWAALVNPPLVPYAPALRRAGIDLERLLWLHDLDERETLWAAEQSLATECCGLALAWPGRVKPQTIRRLQLAAEANRAIGCLVRPRAAARKHSHAAIRAELSRRAGTAQIELLKLRGGNRFGPMALGDAAAAGHDERPPAPANEAEA